MNDVLPVVIIALSLVGYSFHLGWWVRGKAERARLCALIAGKDNVKVTMRQVLGDDDA